MRKLNPKVAMFPNRACVSAGLLEIRLSAPMDRARPKIRSDRDWIRVEDAEALPQVCR